MKKKGLIISTIVMVVVLIASLTTATYAWFAATAEVSVNDVTIMTRAAEGLQLAVNNAAWTNAAAVNENNLFNGSVSYESNAWNGEPGWGSEVNLSSTNTANFANMENAVTRAIADTRYPYTVTVDGQSSAKATATYAEASGGTALDSTAISNLKAADNSDPENPVAADVVYCTYAAGEYLVPTAYDDSTITPTAYTAAAINGNYLVLPIVLQATSGNVAQVYYTVTVTPNMDSLSANLKPGMAAASRILLNDSSSDNDLFQPFNDAVFSGSTMVKNGTTTKYSELSGEEAWKASSWVYSGFVYNGDTGATAGTWGTDDTVMPAYTAQQFYLTVWIEGTDEQCKNLVAGSGFTISVDFGYVKIDGTLKTSSDVGVGKSLAA